VNDTITTERLVLRRFVSDDVAALHAIMSDPDVMQFWSTLPHANLVQTEEYLARTIASVDAGESDDFAVIHDGELVGKAGLRKGNEMGFLFAKSVWGTGIAQEAVDAIIERARLRNIPTIMADVDPRNVRSVKFLERLGFKVTGEAKNTYLIGGQWTNSVYLELRLQ
jgi:RimJ/RimL family protein N-acetyltransferase